MMCTDERALMTTSEVAAYLNVSESSLKARRLRKQDPPYIKIGSLVRYRPCDIEMFLADCTVVSNADSRLEALASFMDDCACNMLDEGVA